jgi:hypothetical protein
MNSPSQAHWAEKYIWADWRWAENGNGPTVWNCWNFDREVQRAEFGRHLPPLPIGDSKGVLAALEAFPARAQWRKRLAGFCEGDIVVMRGVDLHVGVWVEADGGGVLHCQRDLDVCFDDLPALAAHGFRIERAWAWLGN